MGDGGAPLGSMKRQLRTAAIATASTHSYDQSSVLYFVNAGNRRSLCGTPVVLEAHSVDFASTHSGSEREGKKTSFLEAGRASIDLGKGEYHPLTAWVVPEEPIDRPEHE